MIGPVATIECPFCPWRCDATITVTDPAPGCTSAETFAHHRAELEGRLAIQARAQLAAHLDEAHPDRALPS